MSDRHTLAAAPAGGEELDEPSVPPSGPLSADESDEDLPDLPASFCVGPAGADPSTGADPFLDKDALDATPPTLSTHPRLLDGGVRLMCVKF